MLTSLGKYLRKLRIDRGEILRDMAQKLEVSSAFLSAVENGKKKMPMTWLQKLGSLYALSQDQMEELEAAAMESNGTVELNLQNAPPKSRKLAVSFARQFDTLDEETAKKLFDILEKHKGE